MVKDDRLYGTFLSDNIKNVRREDREISRDWYIVWYLNLIPIKP